jgi:hypothetical protein
MLAHISPSLHLIIRRIFIMNGRRTLLSGLVAVLLAFAALPRHVAAQQVTWCNTGCYTVDLTKLAPFPNCHPCIRTSWGAGAVVWPPAGQPCYNPGVIKVECPIPVLPIGTLLDWVDVCGVRLPGVQGQYSVPTACPGCPPLCVRICVDTNGCLYIKVYPGPCPAGPLPCP